MAGIEVRPSTGGGPIVFIADQDEVELTMRPVGKFDDGNEDLFVRLLNATPKRY